MTKIQSKSKLLLRSIPYNVLYFLFEKFEYFNFDIVSYFGFRASDLSQFSVI